MNPKNRWDNRQGLLNDWPNSWQGPFLFQTLFLRTNPTLVLCFEFLQAFLRLKEQVYYLESLTGDETGDEISRSQEEIITQGNFFLKSQGTKTSFLNEIGHH